MVYLDYAATTPYNKDVLKTYTQLLEKYFYNADSIYSQGIEVNRLLEKSRGLLAKMLDVDEEEMIFTSCGSEANNMAIKGIAFQYQNRGKHIITTSIEHSSVYETCKELEEVFGFEVTYLPVDHTGHIQIDDLKKSLRNDSILVSVMCINNEVGSIQPIEEIKNVLKDHPLVKFHVDMVQALGKIKIDLKGIDCASFSAHKINGLKGSGLLFKRKSTTLVPLINGGQQEFGLRGGTSNACTYIVLAKTLRLALENFDQIIPDNVFKEVTSISLDEFKKLRDGFNYVDENTFVAVDTYIRVPDDSAAKSESYSDDVSVNESKIS